MLYSSACEYAIRALTHLSRRPPGDRARLDEIAEEGDLPAPYLGKILKELVAEGLLTSARGPGGGYALAYPPAEITLMDVKDTIDGTRDLERCAVGLDPCSDETPCPLHDTFKPIREAIRAYLEETTLEDLARGLWEKEALLARRELAASGGSAPVDREATRGAEES